MKYLLLLLLMTGCVTHSLKDYECFRFHGPFSTSAESVDEAERYVREIDWDNKQQSPDFGNWGYQCIEVQEPRPRVDFHTLEMGRK